MYPKLKRFWCLLKFHGPRGILLAVCRRFAPPKAKCRALCAEIVKGRSGLEIGGSSAIFREGALLPIYPFVERLDNCNFGENTIWEGSIKEGLYFQFDDKHGPGHQYIAEAANLDRIQSKTYDFLISSHVLEHVANPLGALTEWKRVLKDDGAMIIVVPHRDGTFDHRRPVTTLEHLIDDQRNATGEDDLTHLSETLLLHDRDVHPGGIDFKTLQERSSRNLDNRCLHHHVFDTLLLVRVIDHLGFQIRAVEPILPFHIIVVATKPPEGCQPRNELFTSNNSEGLRTSPFRSDRVGAKTPA